ncbi:protein FAM210A [Bufo gargarizans]|uniref:protein FAM210A n=1 Tax=Bufo gargarizans TaxID=30331 RepID=UPI001CF26D9B|nr:protein FAM210A [Bufo gargarizans]XP_044149043.1 protein FAM210A [Bufo gargarizans]XP_044149044.1 protein FAM210A [Bufo gargarizans]
MHLLRTLYLRCHSSIISLRACRQQQRFFSPRIGCQVFTFHGQNHCFHSAPRLESSQEKRDGQSPSLDASHPAKSTETAAEAPVTVEETDPLQDKSIGLVQRFKKTFQQYGKVMVTVHVLTSSAWLGTFYYAAVQGINVVPFLEFIGLPESIVNILKNSESGNVLTAYALYKIATPIRYTVTLGGTSVSVKYLRKYGYLSTPPLVKDYIQDKMEETKERFSEKMEETRDIISEKMEVTKDRISEKLQETKESFTFRKKKEE